MRETSKCQHKRFQAGHFDKYLRGDGIDVGCGDDPLCVVEGSVRRWYKSSGDGQYLERVESHSLDFVYSSHCLEHLVDVTVALDNWTRVLKPHGYLYFVVPDYFYYEKMRWPSHFNPEHKHSFSNCLTRPQVGRNNHWHTDNLNIVFTQLKLELLECTLELDGFDFNCGPDDQTLGSAMSQLCFILRKG